MATPARTVQLRSMQQVIEAYQNWDNPQFAILNGKQLLFAYDTDTTIDEGVQLLEQWLTWIKSGGSAGIYTLAIYRDVKAGGITNTTPYNGSINFQLNDYNYSGGGGAVGSVGNPELKLILDQMAAMQLQLNKLQDGDDDDDDDDGDSDTLGKITNLLNNPVIAGLISSLIPAMKPTVKPLQPVSNEQPGAGNVSRIAGATSTDNDQKRIAEALAKLQAAISNLPDVLAQLAKLADKNPGQLQFYITLLMKMKI